MNFNERGLAKVAKIFVTLASRSRYNERGLAKKVVFFVTVRHADPKIFAGSKTL